MEAYHKLVRELESKSVSMQDITITDIVSLIASGAMIFGGVVPYIPQYRNIRKTMSADGFSTLVCFVLLVANLLRVFFWFGKHFELPLLAQSILMIIAMMALVELCVRVKNKTEIVQSRQHHLSGSHSISMTHTSRTEQTFYQCIVDMNMSYFWKWTDFLSYVEFVAALGVVISVLTFIFIDYPVYVETIGFLAVFIEAMLGTPQFYRNYEKKSTEGMSVTMVVMWLCGDAFKTLYFILRNAPTQFWVCGALQILVDIGILGQVAFYSVFPQRTYTVNKPATQ